MKKQQTTNIDFLQALNKYIPSMVLQQLIQRQEQPGGQQLKLPERQPMETAVLWADISGFTALGEACQKQGVRGNEELAFCINRYMEGMIKIIGKYGGDIIKFVGDAMIVMWPEASGPNKAQMTVRKVIQCALDIQKELNNFQVITEVSALSVKIGVGYGKCALLYVGGILNRAEFLTVGPALTQALSSEGMAKQGGQTIVSDEAFQLVSKIYKATELTETKTGKKFHDIESLIGEGVKAISDALQMRANISNQTYNKISQQLRGCVPAAILPYLQIGAEPYGSETRSLTVMFASLGLELSAAETDAGMLKIQKVIETVQQQVYRHGGSVNKLVMDDKGSTMVILWGLSPMAHQDDAVRAINTAFGMRRELMRLHQTGCNIGISSGEMFSGVVGTSGGRKEFSVLGDVVNLAAREMGWAKQRKMSQTIMVCQTTRQLASNTFSFKYQGHSEFKGKSASIPVFEPNEPSVELEKITESMMYSGAFLKLHMNPLQLERDTIHGKVPLNISGESIKSTIKDVKEEIKRYFNYQNSQPYLASIKGEIGSGKTLFARCLIDSLCSDKSFKSLMKVENNLFCGSLDSELQYQFLNIWRPVLTQLLTFYCKRENKIPREQVLLSILQSAPNGFQQNEKFTHILCDIFTVEREKVFRQTGGSMQTQAMPQPSHYPFVSRVAYKEKDAILSLILHFIKLVIGEVQLAQPQFMQQQQQYFQRDQTPILIFLDTTQLMDASSWQLFELIRDNCGHIGVILLQLCDNMGELVINPDAQQVFNKIWHNKRMDQLHQIELPALDDDTLTEILLKYADSYQSSYFKEMELMTEIKVDDRLPEADRATIKTEAMGVKWKTRLMKEWQLRYKYSQIDSSIISTVNKCCAGNPLLCIHYFMILIQTEMVLINQNGLVEPSPALRQCQQINNFLKCPVPRIAKKQNLSLVDQYVNLVYSKRDKRPNELEDCMKSVVMLKSATVLGDNFDSKSLQSLNPLGMKETITNLNYLLKLLESQGFLEIVDESDKDNFKCRFNKPFLRESLYQVVLFRDQKQSLHGAAYRFLLHNEIQPAPGQNRLPTQIQTEILLGHMLQAEDVDNEDKLSFQARTGLIVKRHQHLLQHNPNSLILNEIIYKQGQAANKKTSKRLCTIDSRFFKWYHNDKELRQKKYLGSIPLQFVYQTVSSKMAWLEKPSFSISTTSWFNKLQQDEGQRDFFFACDNVLQLEKWIITIEYLRTRAVFDAYTQRNVPVSFPLTSQGDPRNSNSKHGQSGKDSLLFDFSKSLKSNNLGSGKEKKQHNLSASNITTKDRIGKVESLAAKLKTLYGVGIVTFSHHLQQTSSKATVTQQSAQLGHVPEFASNKITERLDSIFQEETFRSQTSMPNVEFGAAGAEETQRQIFRRTMNDRRSSVDQASLQHKIGLLATLRDNTRDQIHEEPNEGQTSDDDSARHAGKHLQQRRGSQILPYERKQLQGAQQEDSFSRAEQTLSLGTTPPQSFTGYAQPQAIPGGSDEVNRMTFAKQDDLQQLLDPEQKLDHLRSQSPPNKLHVGVSIATQQQRPSVSLTEQPKHGRLSNNSQGLHTGQNNFNSVSQSSLSHDKSNSQSNQQQYASLQQLIEKSLQSGMKQLMQQNKQILEINKDQLSQIVQQSLENSAVNIGYQSPTKRQLKEQFESRFQHNQNGVTSSRRSTQQNREMPASKRAASDDDIADPGSISPAPDSRFVQGQQSINFKSSSIDQQYALYEQPKQVHSKKREYVAECISRSSCLQGSRLVVPEGAQILVTDTLPQYNAVEGIYNQQKGVFLKKDFRAVQQQQASHFFQEVSSRQHLQQSAQYSGQMGQSGHQEYSARQAAEDQQNTEKRNSKMLDRLKKKQLKNQSGHRNNSHQASHTSSSSKFKQVNYQEPSIQVEEMVAATQVEQVVAPEPLEVIQVQTKISKPVEIQAQSIPVPMPVPVAVPEPAPPVIEKQESVRQENMQCPDVITEIAPIYNDDWEQHFKKFQYTDAQKDIVRRAQQKMKEWFEENEKNSEWKRGTDKKGLTVDCKQSSRGNNMLRACKTMPFTPWQIYLTICEGKLRPVYDTMIEKTEYTSKLATNTYTSYQKTKKMFILSSRDLMVVLYMHKHKDSDNISIIAFGDPSIESVRPVTSACVRATVFLGGFYLEKVGQSQTKVTLIQEIDLAGSVPKMAYSSTNDMQAEQLNKLVDVVAKHSSGK